MAKYVMSESLYVSVCLSVWQRASGTTPAIYTNFSLHVAFGRGSVLLCCYVGLTEHGCAALLILIPKNTFVVTQRHTVWSHNAKIINWNVDN